MWDVTKWYACLPRQETNTSISLPVMDDLQLQYALQTHSGQRHESRTYTGRLYSTNVREVTFQLRFYLYKFPSHVQLVPFLIFDIQRTVPPDIFWQWCWYVLSPTRLKKTTERSPFFVRCGEHCCRGDLVGRKTFRIFFFWVACKS